LRVWVLAVVAGMIALGAGCGRRADDGMTVIRVWCHQGQEAENAAMRGMVEAFNRAHAEEGLRVDLEFFPDYQYAEKISTAAAVGDLPDVMDLDGPTVTQYVAAGLLQPLDEHFASAELADFLETLIEQGTVEGRLYALGAFDSAMGLYYDRVMFAAAGVEAPAEGEAWMWDEFVEACRQLKGEGIDPVALHTDITADEWYTYAFSPLVWSAGGRLIAEDGVTVQGVLNPGDNARVLRQWQRLFEEDYAARRPADPDPFGSGATAMDWNGHWMVRSHQERKGERLGLMPLPRTGGVAAAACGSWAWALTSQARDTKAAVRWLRWVLDAEHGIVPIVQANGAIPGRLSALEALPEYLEPPYSTFVKWLREGGRPRPRTRHYTTLSRDFAAALRDIAGGAEVPSRLDDAAQRIQRSIDREGPAR